MKKFLFFAIAFVSFTVIVVTSSQLLLGNFPSKNNVTAIYFAYAAASLVFAHAVAFWINHMLMEMKGKGLSKNAPRYIDYGITMLIAIGLVQIYFSDEVFGKYITRIGGTKHEVLQKIKTKAEAHLEEDCTPRNDIVAHVCNKIGATKCEQKGGFTPDFCAKLGEISMANDMESFVSNVLGKDTEFLNHPIGYVATPSGPHFIKSPIASFVNQYVALSEFGVAYSDQDRQYVWSWIVLILLPIIISMRAVKTSLEIFGKLS